MLIPTNKDPLAIFDRSHELLRLARMISKLDYSEPDDPELHDLEFRCRIKLGELARTHRAVLIAEIEKDLEAMEVNND